MESVNKNLKRLRKHLRLTQHEFATMLNITQASVSQIESGSNIPSVSLLIRLHGCYPKLNFNWLLKGEGQPFAPDVGNTNKQIRTLANAVVNFLNENSIHDQG